ncbi:hypothetical protein EYF80_063712 [Liparis tanakae]|uniref:Uncharacterized protein n=1 Tax=Liparis tanakae TaxID=230148 RepID=A0A4Z2EBM2_9TELE|nr:hypothetical protein EYF80_063712 [Liparis tanakae]
MMSSVSVDRGSRDLDDDIIELQPCVVDKEMRRGPGCVSCGYGAGRGVGPSQRWVEAGFTCWRRGSPGGGGAHLVEAGFNRWRRGSPGGGGAQGDTDAVRMTSFSLDSLLFTGRLSYL